MQLGGTASLYACWTLETFAAQPRMRETSEPPARATRMEEPASPARGRPAAPWGTLSRESRHFCNPSQDLLDRFPLSSRINSKQQHEKTQMPIPVLFTGTNCKSLQMFHGSMLGQVQSPGSWQIFLRASKLLYASKFSPYNLTL